MVAGVTGTNGKTTTTHLLRDVLETAGIACGVIGTLGGEFRGERWPLSNTTPLALELHALLAAQRRAGAQAVAMEVSSHALALHRVDHVRFRAAALTNVTRDHLDFHGTLERYVAAKRRLFELAPVAVLNVDDPAGAALARELTDAGAPPITYALDAAATLRADDVVLAGDGSTFRVGDTRIELALPGRFNVRNALAAFGLARALGIDDAAIARGLATTRAVPGRMERFGAFGIDAIVDYAHTPDALENVLRAAREMTKRELIVVFGCGGDRDPGKRSEMGEIAARLADRVIVTSDNPRSEDPLAIALTVADGYQRTHIELDRRSAIRRAIDEAHAGDTVVVAGKGPRDLPDRRRRDARLRRPRRSPHSLRQTRPGHPKMNLNTLEAIDALRARVAGAEALPESLLVQTDTRALERGATFLALRGENFDGHDYVDEAFARGAACAIVDAAHPQLLEGAKGRSLLIVPDTLRAYLELGALARTHLHGTVVAITGSTGKTTTKQFLLALLRGAGIPVTATPENENNEVGVAKFLCGLDDGDARVAIVEMGARKYRDLDVLVATARPDVGVLTNVGEAHLEIMGSRGRIADTKWTVPAGSGRAVLNLDDPASRERAASLALPPLWFGLDDERPPRGARAVAIEAAAVRTIADDGTFERHPIEIGFPGDHNRRNLAAAFAAALLCSAGRASAAELAGAVRGVALPHGRYEVVDLPDDVRLVFDAYNASLSGTLATLATFGREEAERRIAVLGSMAELGDDAPSMHEKIGEIAATRADVVLAGGAYASDTARGVASKGGTVVRYADNDDAIAWLRANVRRGDAILLKGSRMYKMEQIAEALGAAVFA